jgi:hypothetical protein
LNDDIIPSIQIVLDRTRVDEEEKGFQSDTVFCKEMERFFTEHHIIDSKCMVTVPG